MQPICSVLSWTVILLLAAPLRAMGDEGMSPVTTRRDLALAYLDFEAAMADHRPEDQVRTIIAQRFDWVAGLFFRNEYARVVRELDALADLARPPQLTRAADRAARALRVQIEPPVLVPDAGATEVQINLHPLYEVRDAPRTLTLQVRRQDHSEPAAQFAFAATGHHLTWEPPADLPPGRYLWEVVSPAGNAWRRSEWHVLPADPVAMRQALLKRLEAIQTDSPALRRSTLAARSRALLVSERPSQESTTSMLVNLAELMEQLPAEVADLEAGRDPYAHRGGDYWRSVDAVAGPALSLPARFYASPAALEQMRAGRAVPLVIALHGAGGDENLFMDGYGNGRIKSLADQYGFVVIAPGTYRAMTDFRSLREIIETAGTVYHIDRQRVYAIGHSLGAMTVGLWAGQQPELLAGIALIAGGSPDVQLFPEPGQPVNLPAFVAAAQHDSIFPPDRLEHSARRAAAGGARVEFKRYLSEGHVSLVEEAIVDAVEWLLGGHGR